MPSLRLLSRETHRHIVSSVEEGGDTQNAARQNEQRLLEEMRRLSQTGAQSRREVVWGLYRQLVKLPSGVGGFSSQTTLRLFELVAGDSDMVRAMERVYTVLDEITSVRMLTGKEREVVRRIWDQIESARRSSELWKPVIPWPIPDVHRSQDPQEGDRRSITAQTSAASLFDAANDCKLVTKGGKKAIEELRELLRLPQARIGLTQMRAVYRRAVLTTSRPSTVRLSDDDMRSLIKYCIKLGPVAGERFLAQIELELAADPHLCPHRNEHLISTYSKLGLLGHARRVYKKALSEDISEHQTAFFKWIMCHALFISLRHKEGREIFDELVETRKATSYMYSVLIGEYTIMRNKERAFALFKDARKRRMRLSRRAINMLAVACALETDTQRSQQWMNSVIAYMQSWRMKPDIHFFIGLLKGYDRSLQFDMFDGLVARLRFREIGANVELEKVIMYNAAARNDIDKTMSMARLVAKAPDHLPGVVRTLCNSGLVDRLSEVVDLQNFPDNKTTANMRLEVAVSTPINSARAWSLLKQILSMVARGLAPSTRLCEKVIKQIWLYDGRQGALAGYKDLMDAGVSKSISMTLLALQLYLRSSTPRVALELFDELCERWAAAEFGSIILPYGSINRLLTLMIEVRGLDAAEKTLAFLGTLPIELKYLPFMPLIEHYINYRHLEKLHSMVNQIVQHSIPIPAHGVAICCRYFSDSAGFEDFAIFLRYVQRIGALKAVPNNLLSDFVVRCLNEHKMGDFEWICAAMAGLKPDIRTWRTVIGNITPMGRRVLSTAVHLAITSSEEGDEEEMALTLIRAAPNSIWRAFISTVALRALHEANVSASTAVYNVTLASLVNAWKARKAMVDTSVAPIISQEFLAQAIYRNIDMAVTVGVDQPLITVAFLAISSNSPTAYKKCLEILEAIHPEQRTVELYGAIARGCALFGATEGIQAILEVMEQANMPPTVEILNIIIAGYAKRRLPSSILHEQRDAPLYPTHSTRDPGAEEFEQHDLQPDPEAIVQEPELDKHNVTEPPASAESEQVGHYSSIPHGARAMGFYKRNLKRIQYTWDIFDQYELSPNQETYAELLHALTNAQKYDEGEELVRNMINHDLAHDDHTAFRWIALRISRGDISGALNIFSAITSSARCKALSLDDPRYNGLDTVVISPRIFVIFIHHYATSSNPEHAMMFLRAMHKHQLKARPWVYAMLLKEFALADRRDLFVELMKNMLAVKCVPNEDAMEVIKRYSTLNRINPSEAKDDTNYDT
ncbi:hypothetical protein H4R20_004019 [Coemansia guatemalensis]|uniref:Pentacotripeptide-repeat region of PRORP domain-containing protein n=1 Tax=Coemansia guatemalensis TaxID=2761395 RepID=A0A9W8HSS3_9FUNG|nr:hypothetical protein H4R20_004019 [Coemansia guatemalensis]